MDIEHFLGAEKAAGTVDSEGAFTIDLLKARRKLGKFQFDDPSFYLLKIVQAAVSGGATRVDLRTTRESLSLCFDSPAPVGDLETLLAAFANPLEAPEGPLRYLAMGFNASLVSDPKEIRLAWWNGEEGSALTAIGEELSVTNAPPRPANAPAADHLTMFAIKKDKTAWPTAAATAAEVSTVRKFCGYTPIEVRLDGRLLKNRLPEAERVPWLATYSEPFLLVERLVADITGGISVVRPVFKRRHVGESGWVRETRKAETFCVQPLAQTSSPVRCRNAYSIPLGLRGRDRIKMICDGIQVASVTVCENGAGAQAVMTADHLSFDVSGFGLIRDEHFDEMVKEARAAWKGMAESVRPDIRFLKSTVVPTEKKETNDRSMQSVGSGGLGCLASFILLDLLPALPNEVTAAILFGIPVVAGVLPRLRKRTNSHQRLRDAVIHRLDELAAQSWPGSTQ